MIITRIRGGLGNQLFQYAAGHSFAKRLNRLHFLDVRSYGHDNLRTFGLKEFNISAEIAEPKLLPPEKETRLLAYAAWKHFGLKPKYVRDKTVLNGIVAQRGMRDYADRESIYLGGLWCSEAFFKDCAESVRSELGFPDAMPDRSRRVLQDIRSRTSVALHVRRDDYVSNAQVATRFGTCSMRYYERALDYVRAKLGEEFVVFVFSDDLDWAKKNLKLDADLHFVDAASKLHPHEDLRLMAACDHNITANSTFSWWGAWLNGNSEKIVVCPEIWYLSRKKRNKHVVPAAWKAIPAFD